MEPLVTHLKGITRHQVPQGSGDVDQRLKAEMARHPEMRPYALSLAHETSFAQRHPQLQRQRAPRVHQALTRGVRFRRMEFSVTACSPLQGEPQAQGDGAGARARARACARPCAAAARAPDVSAAGQLRRLCSAGRRVLPPDSGGTTVAATHRSRSTRRIRRVGGAPAGAAAAARLRRGRADGRGAMGGPMGGPMGVRWQSGWAVRWADRWADRWGGHAPNPYHQQHYLP